MIKKNMPQYDFMVYKNRPLIRCGNAIYYGNVDNKYIVKLEILNYKSLFNNEIANKILVKLLSTDGSLSERNKIIKLCEKDGLYMALDVADAWLNKALSE